MTARGWAGRWLVAEEAFVGGNENLVCGGGGSRADVCTLAAMSAGLHFCSSELYSTKPI